MRSTGIIGLVLGIVVMAGTGGAIAGQPTGGARVVRTGQAAEVKNQYDERTGLWFTTQLDQQGRPSTQIKGKDLSINKSMADGQLSLDIRSGTKSLSIRFAQGLIELRSGKKTVRFNPRKATEANYEAAKDLLASSRVVGLLRAAAAGTGAKVLESDQGLDLLLTEALVALLDGDPGPTKRVRERIQTRLSGAVVNAASTGGGDIGRCYGEWRIEVYQANNDLINCLDSFSVFNLLMRNLCNLEFLLRAEAAWAEFLTCSLGSGIFA